MEIQKKIHQTWYKKELPSSIQQKVNRIKSLHKNYQYYFYDDNDILNYIDENYDSRILKAYKKLFIGASKADYFRYLVLYKEGGIYLDLDSDIVKNIDPLIENKSGVISREGNKPYFLQWMMCFCKGHPILKKIIDITTDNILENKSKEVLFLTGPRGPYTQGINDLIKIKNLWDKKDSEINEELKNNEDDMLKNTVFYGIDYEEYAKYKCENNLDLYSGVLTWRAKQDLYNNRYLILISSLFLILVIYKLVKLKLK